MTVSLAELDLRLGPDFFTPFTPSTAAIIADPSIRNRLPVSIGDRDFVLDLAQYQRGSIDPFRWAQDPSHEPGEQSLSIQGVWKRTQFSWHMGAGQEYADDVNSNRERFWTSRHVDVWSKRRVALLRDVDSKRTGVSKAMVAGVHVYVLQSGVVNAAQIANDTQLATPSWVNQTPTHTPVDWCSDGDHVFYATGGTGVYKATTGTPGDVLLNVAGLNADRVWFVNGWLLVADGNKLLTLSASGVQTPVYTHLNASFTWVDVCGTPEGIFAIGHDSIGSQTAIYSIGISSDGSALSVPVSAGELPTGETGLAIFYYQGRLCIGTNQGARFASMGNASINIGPVIPIGAINDFAAYGRYVWGAGTPGLWRFDLSNETESLVPAYASDLEAPSPLHATIVLSSIVGILFVDANLYSPSRTKYCASGTITTGWFGFGSPERKVLSAGSVRAEPMPGDGLANDASITMTAEDDAGTLIDIGTMTEPGTRDPGLEWNGQNLDSELIRITFTLTSTATLHDSTPAVRRMTMRMLIAPVTQEEIVAPVLVADKVAVGEGKRHQFMPDPFEVYRYFRSLEESRQIIDYREGQIIYRVTVRSVSMAKPSGWTKDKRFFESTVTVHLMTERGVPPDTGENH